MAGPVSAPAPRPPPTQCSVNWTKRNNPAASTQELSQNQTKHKHGSVRVSRVPPKGHRRQTERGKALHTWVVIPKALSP